MNDKSGGMESIGWKIMSSRVNIESYCEIKDVLNYPDIGNYLEKSIYALTLVFIRKWREPSGFTRA